MVATKYYERMYPLTDNQKRRIKNGLSVNLDPRLLGSGSKILLTMSELKKLEKAKAKGEAYKRITFSQDRLKKMSNMSGNGWLSGLLGVAKKLAPVVLPKLAEIASQKIAGSSIRQPWGGLGMHKQEGKSIATPWGGTGHPKAAMHKKKQ